MTTVPRAEATQTRERLLERALFRGADLTLENPAYRHAVWVLTSALLADDLNPRDLTVAALGLENRSGSAVIVAREPGVVAGLAELKWLLRTANLEVELHKSEGEIFEPGEILLTAQGPTGTLLSFERVGLNLLQRMCGIAAVTRALQTRVQSASQSTRIVATRKTPWGLLDKRAVHLGGGGTHRLGLGDAILIKNNHLALLGDTEEQVAPIAIRKAWRLRQDAAFIEVEVRGERAAVAAARAFQQLRQDSDSCYPCLLLLDNMEPAEIDSVLLTLRQKGLWDDVLIEASGGISESNIEAFAACGADAISMGALTHSSRALDLSQRIS